MEINSISVMSERNKRKLIHNGFGFIFDKSSTDLKTNFWRCDHKSRGCKARLHAVAGSNDFIRLMNEHNHDSKGEKVDKTPNREKEIKAENDIHDEVETSEGAHCLYPDCSTFVRNEGKGKTSTSPYWLHLQRRHRDVYNQLKTAQTENQPIERISLQNIMLKRHMKEVALEEVIPAKICKAKMPDENLMTYLGSIRQLADALVNRLQNDQIQRYVSKRARSEISPSVSRDEDEKVGLEIPEEDKLFNLNEKFLLADSFDHATFLRTKFSHMDKLPHILIFGRESNASWIGQMKQIFVHSSTQQVPQPFKKMCVIWSERVSSRGLQTFPILYVLLENQSEESYGAMFSMIRRIWPQFDPDSLTLEFDRSLINSAYDHFEQAAILGCFDDLKEKMHSFLIDKVDNYTLRDAQFLINCRMVTALAFVPPTLISKAFEELSASLSHNNTYTLLLKWFEENFIGKRVKNNHRRRPNFAPQIWSCHQQTLNSDTLSNKNSTIKFERLQNELGFNSSLSICEFIGLLRELQSHYDSQMEDFLVGSIIKSEFDDQRECQQKLFELVSSFGKKNGEKLIDYLFKVAQELNTD